MAMMMTLSSCGAKHDEAATSPTIGSVTSSGISADRCQANRDLGQITYLTSFDYASSASIIDVVAADAQGYFKKMCLNVKLQAGFTTTNVPLVSSGKVAFSSLSSASEVAADVEAPANIEAIALYGHSAVDELAVSDKADINKLSDIKGTTMGVLGSIPYDIREMLVTNGVPLNSFKQTQVPQDPTLLDKGDFQSRPVYKSSEPRTLDQAGVKYHVFDPASSGTTTSFGAMIVNTTFARQHPTAVDDFLRADLEGFNWALANPDQAVHDAFVKADPKYYLTEAGEQFRWSVESKLVKQSTPTDEPYGYMTDAQWSAEMKPMIYDLKVVPQGTDLHKFYDTRFLNDVYNGTKLIWPSGN
jgi:ABC-type nitrate/sulfonate/bicarbonate transport system substrate-binding protein